MNLQGAIVAQIAITAQSLPDINRTHWTARGLFTFSLVSSLVAVYHANRQNRVMGRCMSARDIKSWIERPGPRFSEALAPRIQFRLFRRSGPTKAEYKPAMASLLAISAPTILLSASLYSLLVGLGVYLGMLWSKGGNERASESDDFNIFLVYIIGLGVCFGIYALSELLASGNNVTDLELQRLLEESALRHNEHLSETHELQRSQLPAAANQRAERTNRNTQHEANELRLAAALEDAAISRERSVEADTRLAELYRELARLHKA
jgi:hypothetical protein